MDNHITYIGTAGSTLVKTGRGTLKRIVVGTTSAGVVRVYDSVGSGGTQIAELKASVAEGSFDFDGIFATGLYIENPIGSKITVIWR